MSAHSNWPQLQNGPLRHGYSAEKLRPPFAAAWHVSFPPERIHPANQPIVFQGKLYVGTQSGNLYALDSATGKTSWKVSGKGPILGAAGASDGKVFFASLDGCVYAVRAQDGAEIWTFRSNLDTGFSSAVTLAEGCVFVINRAGAVYALNQDSGGQLWRREVGVPVLQSPACLPSEGDRPGMLFFGGMDMRVYALSTRTGEVAWRSERLYGQAFKDYWPVVYRDKVIIRSMIAYPKPKIASRTRFFRPETFPLTWGDPFPDPSWFRDPATKQTAQRQGRWYREHSDQVARGEIPKEIDRVQEKLAAHYRQHPEDRDMFVLDAGTGKEAIVVPHWCGQTMNGATSPPCVDRDGLLVVPVMYINSRWGRLDLAKNRVVDILYDGRDYGGRLITEIKKPGWIPVAGGGNTDENMIVSAAGDLVFSFHCQESNANYTGVWDMNRRRWSSLQKSMKDWGAYANNTQGGGASPALVANGLLYHASFHTITAWRPAATREDGR